MKRQIERRVFPALRLAVLSVSLLTSCGKTSQPGSGPNKDPEQPASERGPQIITEYLKRDAARYRQTRVRLTISDVRNQTQVYELDVWRKQTGDETLTLTQIAQPAAQRPRLLLLDLFLPRRHHAKADGPRR